MKQWTLELNPRAVLKQAIESGGNGTVYLTQEITKKQPEFRHAECLSQKYTLAEIKYIPLHAKEVSMNKN